MSDEHQGQGPNETAGQPQPEPPQGAPNGIPQWVPVPPPHPYAGSQSAPPTPGGKAVAITAMAVGLVALLTIFVSVAYFSVTVAIASGVLGIVAVSLGVIALVKKLRPTGAAITGLASGALSMVAVTGLIGAGALVAQFGVPPADAGSEGQPGDGWKPGTAQESLLEWPANMSSGGIVFEGPGDPRPRNAEPLEPGTAPTPNQVNRGVSNDILVYVDYRCPHCMVFDQQNSDYLAELVAAGDTTVEIVPLSFMDRMSEGQHYSSRAAGAVACFVDSQPEAAWDAHNTLLTPEVQPGAGPGLSNGELIAALEQGVGDMESSVRDCIETERFVPFAQGLNEWAFQNPVPNTVANSVRLEGTPTILVNGLVYPGDPSNPEMFKAFVEEQAN